MKCVFFCHSGIYIYKLQFPSILDIVLSSASLSLFFFITQILDTNLYFWFRTIILIWKKKDSHDFIDFFFLLSGIFFLLILNRNFYVTSLFISRYFSLWFIKCLLSKINGNSKLIGHYYLIIYFFLAVQFFLSTGAWVCERRSSIMGCNKLID